MPTQLQLRRGTTTEHSTFSGAVGEVTVDTTKDTLIVHDGATNGGFPLAKEAGATFGNTNVTGNFSFADNAKAIFGAGSDLQIYHDSSDSYITEGGTGSLYIGADSTIALTDAAITQNKAQFITGGAVNLFHNNAQKFATTSFGAQVTGSLAVDTITNASSSTNVTIDTNFDIILDGGSVGIGNSSPSSFYSLADNLVVGTGSSGNGMTIYSGSGDSGYIGFNDTASASMQGFIQYNHNGDYMAFAPNGTEKMRITSSGNVGIGASAVAHKLTVNASAFDGIQLQSGGSDCGYLGVSTDTVYVGAGSNLVFHTGNSGLTNGTERMRIDNSGRLLIGATVHSISGSQKFEVQGGISAFQLNDNSASPVIIKNNNSVAGNGVPYIVLQDSSGNRGAIYRNSSNEIGLHGQNALTFHTGTTAPTTERMRIDSSGNLLVGTTSSTRTARQQIYANSATEYTSLSCESQVSTNVRQVRFHNTNGLVGSINTNGSATSYLTSSDYRLKNNVTYDWDATTRLKQLKPARFAWIADGDDAVPVDGFLAHEVQDVVPEAISGTKDGMMDEEYEVTPAVLDEDGNEVTPAVMGTRSVADYQGIDQSKLVPLLVKTIQELEARITALEAN